MVALLQDPYVFLELEEWIRREEDWNDFDMLCDDCCIDLLYL